MSITLEALKSKASMPKISVAEAESFGRKSNNTILVLNKRVKVPGSIKFGDTEDTRIQFNTWATLRNADWHRITVRDHEVKRVNEATRISQVVGLGFRNVAVDLEIEIDGQTIPFDQFMFEMVSANFENDGSMTDEDFKQLILKKMYDCGIRLNGGMTLFTQHMGASVEGYQHVIENFKRAGAIDDIKSVAALSQFHTCYDFLTNQETPKIVSFEMIPVDRKQNKGEGFIDLLDSVYENYKRMWNHFTRIQGFENEVAAGNLSQAKVKELNDLIATEKKMANQHFTCISGANRQKERDTGKLMDKYNPQNVPCGRWSASINSEVVDFDVWANSTNKPSADFVGAAPATIDTTQKPF